jgi:hypothetical protein
VTRTAAPGPSRLVVILTQLGVPQPVPAFDAPERSLTGCRRPSGVVRRLVSNRCRRREGLPARLPTSSRIQLLPGPCSVMISGAAPALSVQVVSRP